MKSFVFLFWAYNVIWIALAGFLLFMILRIRTVGRRLDAMERALDNEAKGAQESSDS